MASTFKNAGMAVPITDDSSANLYTAAANEYAVVHALFISNKSTTSTAKVNVKVSTDGGSTFYHVAKKIQIPANNTLTLDKPINLESSDKLRVIAHPLPDSSTADLECYASILEIS